MILRVPSEVEAPTTAPPRLSACTLNVQASFGRGAVDGPLTPLGAGFGGSR
jgi:hypothetical protein